MSSKIKVGVIVQNNSRDCDSIIDLLIIVLFMIDMKLYLINIVIIIKIIIMWSWKNVNSSIKGEEAFWKFKAEYEAIIKGYIISFMKLKFITLFCHIN